MLAKAGFLGKVTAVLALPSSTRSDQMRYAPSQVDWGIVAKHLCILKAGQGCEQRLHLQQGRSFTESLKNSKDKLEAG